MACARKGRGKYVVDWRDGAGIRHWRTYDKKRDAEEFRDKVGSEARHRLVPTVPPTIKTQEYVDHWKRLIAHTVKARTLARYTELFTLHILPRFEKVRVRNLDRGQIKLFLTEKLSAGYEKRTVRNTHAVLRAMLNSAIEDGVIVSNPAAKLGRVLKLTVSKSTAQEEIKALTKDQRQLLLLTAYREAPRYYPLFFVLAGTGMRLSEALQPGDLDATTKMLRISRAFSEDGILDTPKSGHGRTVDMSRSLTEVVMTQELGRRQEKLKFGWGELPPWLFVTKAGTPLDPANVRRAMQSLLKKAKLPLHFTPHCLRHTYASILLADGVSPVYVQEQLGHATIELTVSTYGRWLKKQATGVLDRLDTAMNFERGSKVIAAASYPRNAQGGANLQLPEIPWNAMEPATRIERVTCGLRRPDQADNSNPESPPQPSEPDETSKG